MKKYFALVMVVTIFLIGTPFIVQKTSAADMSFRDFVDLLVVIGVISPATTTATATTTTVNTSATTTSYLTCGLAANKNNYIYVPPTSVICSISNKIGSSSDEIIDGRWYWSCKGKNLGWDLPGGLCFISKNPPVIPIPPVVPVAPVITTPKVATTTMRTIVTSSPNNSSINASCLADPATQITGRPTTWTADVSGGNYNGYNFRWGGAIGGSLRVVSTTYTTPGLRSSRVVVTDSAGNSGEAVCSTNIIDQPAAI